MILDDIVIKTKLRLKEIDAKEREKMEKNAYKFPSNKDCSFYKALSKEDLSFVAEVKKASPSKGIICENFNPIEIAKEYERISIDAISVLTERDFFQGRPQYLKDINNLVSTPTLRKDFIVDLYQIHEAKTLGASAILLICSILDQKTLNLFYSEAKKLNLDVLVEAHNREEIDKALNIEANIIGINNRDLKTFNIDLSVSERLRKYIPSNKIMVSESGYFNREDIIRARNIGVDAVLIGESFMKSSSKETFLNELKGLTL